MRDDDCGNCDLDTLEHMVHAVNDVLVVVYRFIVRIEQSYRSSLDILSTASMNRSIECVDVSNSWQIQCSLKQDALR